MYIKFPFHPENPDCSPQETHLQMNENMQQLKKRRKENATDTSVVDEEIVEKRCGVKTKGLKEILTSLILLEDQEKGGRQQFAKAHQEESLQLEENHKKKASATLVYYSKFHVITHFI